MRSRMPLLVQTLIGRLFCIVPVSIRMTPVISTQDSHLILFAMGHSSARLGPLYCVVIITPRGRRAEKLGSFLFVLGAVLILVNLSPSFSFDPVCIFLVLSRSNDS